METSPHIAAGAPLPRIKLTYPGYAKLMLYVPPPQRWVCASIVEGVHYTGHGCCPRHAYRKWKREPHIWVEPVPFKEKFARIKKWLYNTLTPT